ncbi:cutinase family protein [Dactylosporangium sp. NPDC000555]|uniref:cutinase family protein n=1 Tax=Dactylosporangium sp. NPDC000555 TaxID=3154260 RepID=UPI0033207509
MEVVFARGTGELPGLGVLGTPLVTAIRSALPGRTVDAYAVNYAAEASQASAGPGATDMSRHVSTVAAACPGTRFVIGGYSQGATVTDIAIGIPFGVAQGTAIPADLASRVAAVVVFGNPLGITHQSIAQRSPVYGPKTKEFCNAGDTICGNGDGGNRLAHLQYATNGSVQQAAQFAAGKLTGA